MANIRLRPHDTPDGWVWHLSEGPVHGILQDPNLVVVTPADVLPARSLTGTVLVITSDILSSMLVSMLMTSNMFSLAGHILRLLIKHIVDKTKCANPPGDLLIRSGRLLFRPGGLQHIPLGQNTAYSALTDYYSIWRITSPSLFCLGWMVCNPPWWNDNPPGWNN